VWGLQQNTCTIFSVLSSESRKFFILCWFGRSAVQTRSMCFHLHQHLVCICFVFLFLEWVVMCLNASIKFCSSNPLLKASMHQFNFHVIASCPAIQGGFGFLIAKKINLCLSLIIRIYLSNLKSASWWKMNSKANSNWSRYGIANEAISWHCWSCFKKNLSSLEIMFIIS
jgi:hypothetical protein